MREIKFRAWSKNAGWGREKCMGFPYLIDFERGVVACHNWHILRLLADEDWVLIDKAVLMQFTGLRDKNGKEIYDGDILETDITSEWDSDVPRDERAVVEWDAYQYWAKSLMTSDWYELYDFPWVVIGNIYENPELLEPKP